MYCNLKQCLAVRSYNTIKTWIQGGNKQQPLGPSMHMLAAAQAGVLTLVMTNPIWVVKTRLCLQYDGPKDVPVAKESINRYGGMVDGLTKIYKYEGVRGLYKVSGWGAIFWAVIRTCGERFVGKGCGVF